MRTPISHLEIDGKDYVVFPKEYIQEVAPQLLTDSAPTKRRHDTIPWEVLKRNLNEDISMAKAWREYFGLSQQDIADRMKISQSAYAQLENSQRPRKSSLERMAKALDLSVEQLKE